MPELEFMPAGSVLLRPEVKEILTDISAIERVTKDYVITTAEQYQAGAEILKTIKTKIKKLDDTRTGITGPMDKALKAVRDLFRGPGDRLAQAERKVKIEIGSYLAEQERLQREEQAKANAAAQRERDRLEELARKAQATGRTAAADQHEARAAQVVAPIVSRAPPPVAGVSARDVWLFEVIDAAQVPREFLMVDEPRVRRYVTAMKADGKIPGVRIYSAKQVAAGSR